MSMIWRDPFETMTPLREAMNRLFEESFIGPRFELVLRCSTASPCLVFQPISGCASSNTLSSTLLNEQRSDHPVELRFLPQDGRFPVLSFLLELYPRFLNDDQRLTLYRFPLGDFSTVQGVFGIDTLGPDDQERHLTSI